MFSIGLAACLLCLALTTCADAPLPERIWKEDGRVRGNPNAPVTLIEYSDFTCGFCVRFFRETWPRLNTKYVETGKLRFIYRDYPRDPQGPGMSGAVAARCAGDQNQYWEMHDRLFSSGVYTEIVMVHAKQMGLDLKLFSKCLRDAHHLQDILNDKKDGILLGFGGTPGFILYRTDRAGQDKPIGLPGALPADVFEREIDRLLKQTEETKKS